MKLITLIYEFLTDTNFRNAVKKLTFYDIEEKSILSDLEQAKADADRMHKLTKYKYYVIVWGKGYKAINMQWVNSMKKKKLLPASYDWLRLEKYSVYVTD